MKQLSLLKCMPTLGVLLLMAPWRGNAAISDGMNAENILGQLDDSDNPVWNTNVPNYRPSAQGFNTPTDIAIDTTTHRLFVVDLSNNRILEFDLDSNNNLVDRVADHVLGQSNFSGFQYQTTQNGMYNPIGLAYDPGGQRLFVSDYNNHRVLVFNISTLSDGQQADYVLGQTDFTSRSSAASQTKMNLPMQLFYDGTTHRLYVPELSNNRVLIFDVSSITNGQAASYVLGQPNFTSNTANTTQSGLNTPRSVKLSTTTQKLFVTDYGNNRVMVYDASALSNGMNAAYVIGQSNFTSNTSATSQTGLNNPYGLAYDPGPNRLFVSEYNNNRVMVFDGTTNTNNPTALNVLGQANFTSGTNATNQSRLYLPRGLAMDSGNKRLYMADGANYRIVYHDVNSIVNGQNATGGLGLQDGSGTDSWAQYLINAPSNNRGFLQPYGVLLDTSTHRLFVSDSRNSRVLVFDLDANDTIVDRVADYVLGQTNFNNAVPAKTQNNFNFPIGLAYDPIGKRLFVGDLNNARIMIYDLSGGLTNGQNASNVLGQLTFTSGGSGSGQNKMNGLRGLAYDPLTHRLYVADLSNNRVLVFDVSTITDGMNASYVLGQPDFTTTSTGLTQNKMNNPYGVALDIAGHRLFVSDFGNKRALVFDVSSLSNGQAATYVLGQPNFTSNGASVSQNGMSGPYGMAHDPISGRLYVTEGTNHRILTYDATALSNGQNAINVLGQSNFSSGSSGLAQNRLNLPVLSFLDPAHHRLFVSDITNHRVVSYMVDLAPSSSTLTAVKGVRSGEVALSWPSAGDEESRGTLNGNYRIQYATYTAAWNTVTTPTNAYTLTIATTGVTPGVVQSTSVAGLLGGVTYSFALFTQDDQGNWSGVSNSPVSKPLDLVAPSTSTLEAHPGAGAGEMTVTWASAGHDGPVGTLTGNYRLQYATFTAAWDSGITPSDATTVNLATTAVIPGSLRSHTITGLATETVWYFALFTQDDEGNWSGVSNTASAVTTADVTPPSAVVDLAASANPAPGSIRLTFSAPGNDGLSGNLVGSYRVQYATFTASWSRTSSPANTWTSDWNAFASPGYPQSLNVGGLAGNTRYYFVLWTRDVAGNWSPISNGDNGVTADWPTTGNGMTMVDVAGSGNGLSNGAVAWGDMDGNGNADLVALGADSGGNPQLRVYSYFGSGAFNPTATEVAGSGNGLKNGTLALGDFNNDGFLDILAEGQDSGGNRQLRVYPNNRDGTFSAPINVAGLNNGLSNGGVAWADFDNDGDLDVLASGTDGSNNQLRIYQNNGNGTFNGTPLNIAGVNSGLRDGGVAWADFDGDGDMDVLVNGYDGTNNQLRVYKNNGNGTFNATPINVAGPNNGLRYGGVAWGDMDNDGKVDVLTNGRDGSYAQLRTYKNNGDGTFGGAVDVAGGNVGVSTGTVTWGDFNNDGNLDALISGRDPPGLVGYWKMTEGNGTTVMDSSGNGNNGVLRNGPTWTTGKHGNAVSFDGVDDYIQVPNSFNTNNKSIGLWFKGADLSVKREILISNGWDNGITNFKGWHMEASYYGDKSFRALVADGNGNRKEIRSGILAENVWYYAVLVHDYDNNIARLYIDGQEVGSVAVTGYTPYSSSGMRIGILSWRLDYNMYFPGDIDGVRIYDRALSASEVSGLYYSLRIQKGLGDGTFNPIPVAADPTNGGLEGGSLAMADVDGDGDLDLAVSGTDGTNPQLRVYLSTQSLTQSNTAPSAPGTLSASFSFSTTTVSVASFTWSSASDNGVGATPSNALTYDIQLSTTADFSRNFFTGALGATPRMGSYLKPPPIFAGGHNGVTLKSTNPWSAQTTSPFGLRTDTTYYYRVKTLDAGLRESNWSSAQTLYTGVAPQSVGDLGLSSWISPGVVDLNWTAPGDDANQSPLTGTYQIQYATFPAVWNADTLPPNAYSVTQATTAVTPGSPQLFRMSGLAPEAPWHFALFTQDDQGNWAGVSNSTNAIETAIPTPPATGIYSSRSESELALAWDSSLGASSYVYAISTAADNPPLAVVAGTSTVALIGTVSALIPNTTYFGFVQACNGIGCSAYTEFGSTVTWANPPITLSTTTLASTSVSLAWIANSNPVGTTYEIEQSPASGGPFSLAISTTGVSTPITGLSPGTTACFRVLARSWDGVPTAPTSELCVVPPFSTPGSSAISDSGTNAILASWTVAPGATSYTFTISTASDNPPLIVIGSSSTVALSATVSSLTPNTTYFGFVKGCNGIDCGNDTALGSVVTLATVPAGLSSGTVTAVSMALAFNINGNPPGTAFEIELAVDGGSFATALSTTLDSPTLSGLTPGVNYTVRVRALNHNSVPTGYSPTLSFTTSATLPATPVNFRGSAGSGVITYSWDPVTTNALGSPLPLGATVSYEFSESNSPTGSFSVLASTTATSHGPLPAAGVEHFYRLRTEVETLFSLPSTVIDNVGAGRYVYPSAVGTAIASPQGLLTGVGNSRHVISLTDRPITDGALVALDIAVIDGVTGTPATNVTFSPSGQLSVPLPGVSSGERSVEYFNGSAWVLAGTAHILSPNLAQFTFGRTGRYRLMGAKSGDVVQSVMARVFTPNGDGRNDVTVVRLNNPNGDPTHGTIYDTDGARVADMATGPAPGLSLAWDGRDANGASVPGGVYIYQVTVGGRRATGTIVVSK